MEYIEYTLLYSIYIRKKKGSKEEEGTAQHIPEGQKERNSEAHSGEAGEPKKDPTSSERA